MFYYKLYDDDEKVNYIKTTFEQKRIRQLLQDFEKAHQEYHNSEFIDFLKIKTRKRNLSRLQQLRIESQY